jgi:hypothetical protein
VRARKENSQRDAQIIFLERASNPYFIAVFAICVFVRAKQNQNSNCILYCAMTRARFRFSAREIGARVYFSLSGVAVCSVVL